MQIHIPDPPAPYQERKLSNMKCQLPDGGSLPCVLTFVPAARPVINAFAVSAEFLLPKQADVEVQLTAEHCRDRNIYVAINSDQDSNGGSFPRITRFLSREQALLANPQLLKVTLQPQAPIQLPVIQKENSGRP